MSQVQILSSVPYGPAVVFDMILKELNLAGMLPPYGANIKTNDTKVVSIHPAVMAAFSERVAA